jgi:proline iminopeptidase
MKMLSIPKEKQLNMNKLLLIILVIFCSCGSKKNSELTLMKTGESYLEVPGGKIWYKVSGTGDGVPVILLHGGPGGSSQYLSLFEQLGNERQVIRYDQLGGGKSDRISDTTFFTVEHFVNELELLRSHLGVFEWHVFGHSWGSTLAMEYYQKFPEHVTSLTFGSPALDAVDWSKSTKKLLTTLPDSLQEAIIKAESSGNFDNSLYEEGMNLFNSKYVWGSNPPQPDFDSMMTSFNVDLYNYMWGANEFSITGTLKDYSSLAMLSKIAIPTLFTVGEFDEIIPEIVKEYAGKVKNSQYAELAGACHMSPWYAPDESVKVLREFLKTVDSQNK